MCVSLSLLIRRDPPNWGLTATAQATERLVRMLAGVHGQLWNASMLAKSLGLSYHTVNRYVDYFIGSFLVRRLAPFHTNLRKRLTKSPIMYWRDSGVLHSLLNVPNVADYLLRLQQERGEIRIVGSAPSQDEFFEHLTSALLLKSIDWDKVVVFHMAEYISLQANHPQSFRTYQQEHFISKIPARTFHKIRGEAADPDAECLRLEALLAEKPLDLICLGMKVDPRVHMAKRRNGPTQTPATPAS